MWPIVVWGTSLAESPPLIDLELFDQEHGVSFLYSSSSY
jgi:hypothetical protein